MPWSIRYFVESDGSIPAAEFEDSLPDALRGKMATIVRAVSIEQWGLGGGYFEICHGYPNLFEVRVKRGRDLAREFCTVSEGLLVLLDGILKAEGEATPREAFDRAAGRLERYQHSRRTV
jgi:hypothetical protein